MFITACLFMSCALLNLYQNFIHLCDLFTMFYIQCNSTLLLYLHSKFLPVFLPFVSLPHSVFSCPFLLFSSSFIQLILLVECLYLCISFSLYFVLYFFLFVYPTASSPLLVFLIHERYWSLSCSNRSSTCSLCSLDLTHCDRCAHGTI